MEFGPLLDSAMGALPTYLGHFAAAVAVLVASILIYQFVTPMKEAALIKAGNVAAATSFSAAVLGMSAVMAAALRSSVSVPDLVLWGVIALVLQLATYFVIAFVFRDFEQRIERGDMAAALAEASGKLGVALLNAAAVSG